MAVKVQQRLCWDSTRRRLLPDGHPDAAFLAYPAGTEVSDEEARRVGIPVAGPAEPKARKTPPADKMAPVPQNKGVAT
jgi:hypothetical protein